MFICFWFGGEWKRFRVVGVQFWWSVWEVCFGVYWILLEFIGSLDSAPFLTTSEVLKVLKPETEETKDDKRLEISSGCLKDAK